MSTSIKGQPSSGSHFVLPTLLSNIADLEKPGQRVEELVRDCMPLLINATQAEAAILWVNENQEGEITWHQSHAIEMTEANESQAFHDLVVPNIRRVFQSGVAATWTPAPSDSVHYDSDEVVELLFKNRHLLLPIQYEGNMIAVVALFQPLDLDESSLWDSAHLSAVAQRVERGIDRIVLSEQNHRVVESELALADSHHQQIVRFGEQISRNLDEAPLAHDIVSELYRLFGAGRFTLAFARGGSCKIRAISNQQVFDKRSAVVMSLTKLANTCIKIRRPIWHPEDASEMPPSLSKQLELYYEAADTQSIALIPLIKQQDPSTDPNDLKGVIRDRQAKPGKVVGVVIIEGLKDSLRRDDIQSRWDAISDLVVNTVGNAKQHSSLFLMPVWRGLGKIADLFRGHQRNKAILATAAFTGLIAAMTLIPADFRVRTKGVIQPAHRARVFAKVEGVVSKMLVQDGDWVTQGQVLLEMENPSLDAELARVEGQLHETENRLETIKLQRIANVFPTQKERDEAVKEAAGLNASVQSLRERFRLLNEKKSLLQIRSPRDGQVVSWDVPRRLFQRPVERGQRLLSIADARGPWELELRVPDVRAGYLPDGDQGSKTSFVIASQPSHVFEGTVRTISESANLDQKDGNVVRVYVDITDQPGKSGLRARPGTEVVAHVHSGRASFGYCKLYEFFDWIKRITFEYT